MLEISQLPVSVGVLLPVSIAILLPVSIAILPVSIAILLPVRIAILLPVSIAILLPVSIAILLFPRSTVACLICVNMCQCTLHLCVHLIAHTHSRSV